MSCTQMPYSWNSARAIRCRTSSLPFSLTGLPVMKSMVSSSASVSTATRALADLSDLAVVLAERFHLTPCLCSHASDEPRTDPAAPAPR